MADNEDGVHVVPLLAFGWGSLCGEIEMAALPGDDGAMKDHVLHSVGQHLAVSQIDCSRMKFITARSSRTREILAFGLAPNKKMVAVSELCPSSGPCSVAISTQQATRHQFDTDLKIERSTALNGLVPRSQGYVGASKWLSSQCHISIYSLVSGRHIHTVSHNMHRFCKVVFSMDSECVVGLASRAHFGSGQALAEAGNVVVWHYDKGDLESLAVPYSNFAQSVQAANVANGRLCLTTSGKQHFKLWQITEHGLKMHSVLQLNRERIEDFVDHRWTEFSSAGAQMPTDVSRKCSKQDSRARRRLILVANSMHCEPDLSTSQDTRHLNEDKIEADISQGSVFVFDIVDQLPYLELCSILPVPLPRGAMLLSMAVHVRGFCLAGSGGFIAVFEHQDDPRIPYALARSINVVSIGPLRSTPSWNHIAFCAQKDCLVGRSSDGSMYTLSLGNVDVRLKQDQGYQPPSVNLAPLPYYGLPPVGPVLAMDICVQRPLIATCCSDQIVRVFKYAHRRLKLGSFGNELIHQEGPAWALESPCCLALHPTGFQLIVCYPERLRLYSILLGHLRTLHEITLMKSNAVKYAHGGHLFVCAVGTNVILFSAMSMVQLHIFGGHVLSVKCLVWADTDLHVFSTGDDGNVYGWDLAARTRIEVASQLNRSYPYHALAVYVPATAVASKHSSCHSHLLGSSSDGLLCEVSLNYEDVGNPGADQVREFSVKASHCNRLLDTGSDHSTWNARMTSEQVVSTLTSLAFAAKCNILFAGTSRGMIRSYRWPFVSTTGKELVASSELAAHIGHVASLLVNNECTRLFSAGRDGVVLVFAILAERNAADDTNKVRDINGIGEIKHILGNKCIMSELQDVIQVTAGEMEGRAAVLNEMSSRLEIQKDEAEFSLHRKDLEWEARLKHIQGECQRALAVERARLDELQDKHDTALREQRALLLHKEAHHVQVIRELENEYQQQIASEMYRFDCLTKEIEAVQQRCEGLLTLQQIEQERAIRAAEGRTKQTEKELRLQIDRLHQDTRHNEQLFREVLDQQEHEYEAELQQLMVAAQHELSDERDCTADARCQIQARNTKIARLEKRLDELKTSSHARNVLLTAEKVRNVKLEATLRHFKRHMEERESTLEDKELAILSLRRKNVTLNNFCFVLDHRMEQLMEEREPVSQHLGGIEAHMRAMYDELEAEYYDKKRQSQQLDSLDLKVRASCQEVNYLRALLREREAYIASFKRELATLVALTGPKELESALKTVYQRFVVDETPSRRHTRNVSTKAHGSQLCRARTDAFDRKGGWTNSRSGHQYATHSRTLNLGRSARLCFFTGSVSLCGAEHDLGGNVHQKINISNSEMAKVLPVKQEENRLVVSECHSLRCENLNLVRRANHYQSLMLPNYSSKHGRETA